MSQKISPPLAKIIPKKLLKFGDLRIDNYFWLKNKKNPAVTQYLKAENRYTDKILADTREGRKKLFQELKKRIKENDQTVPVKSGDYFIYKKFIKGKNYPLLCRKFKNLKAREEIILDCNPIAKKYPFFELISYNYSPDQKILAYAIDTDGSEKCQILFKNLQTKKNLPDKILSATGPIAWSTDCRHLFYTQLDHDLKPIRIFRHRLGKKQDQLIYHEKDSRFFCRTWLTRDQKHILIEISGNNMTEVRFLDAESPLGKFQLIEKRRPNHEYYLYSHLDRFFVLTNLKAPNFKIASGKFRNPGFKNWKTVIPENKNRYIVELLNFPGHLTWQYKENGLDQIAVQDLLTKKTSLLRQKEAVYSLELWTNPNFESPFLRYNYNSPTTPDRILDYHFRTQKSQLKKQTIIPGGHNPNDYRTERIWAPSHDKVKIPITLVYQKGLRRNGKNPLLMRGYGSYGASYNHHFSSNDLSLLKRGFVVAIAHIRGGKELGEKWYQTGKLFLKKNTFYDFIASAKYLIAQKYTSAEKFSVSGGSAGGLLMGTVANWAPHLFKNIIAKVPFVDVINTMLDTTLPLTALEYNEWGNPNIKKFYQYIRSYSPYDNVKKQNYPNLLITAGFNDPRVTYWEPAKWVAKLRRTKTDHNLLLLKTNFAGGHFGYSGRFNHLKDTALEFAFIFKTLGLEI